MRLLDKAAFPKQAAAGADGTAAGSCYAFDEFRLDPLGPLLLRDGQPVELGSRAIQLLIALLERRDRVVGKDELIAMAWPRSTVVENNLPVAIFALRQAFAGRSYIRTVYGRGYRFIGPVQVVPAASGSVSTGAPAHGPGDDGPAPPLPADQPCIAVLPFVTMGAGNVEAGGLDLFGHGIAEDIIGALSRNRWLRVIARNSSFSFRGKAGEEAGVGEVARQLGARYVLEGSIRQAGGRVRVTARLNDASSGTHLLSERWDRVLEDLFAVQDEIAAHIVKAVCPVLFEAEQDRSFRTRPDSIGAWTAYQRGNWFLGRWDDPDLQAAMDWFRQAMTLDPRYAPGRYGMARLLCRAGSSYSPVARPGWQRQAEQLAEEALRLDPRDSGAYVALAWARYMRGDRLGAIAAAGDALALNPSDAAAHAAVGAALVFDGRAAEGIDALQAGIDLDPRDPWAPVRHMQIGLGLYLMGDLAAAGTHAEAMLRAWPGYNGTHRLKAMVLSDTGRLAEARQHLDRAIALWPAPFQDFSNARMPYYRPEDHRRVLAAFRRAGWTGPGG